MNNPNEIAIGFADLGVQKATMPKYRAFLLAVMAGVFISMSGVAATIATSVSGKLAGALIFPAGLIMVVTAGSELFTGDSLMFVSRLERKINAKQRSDCTPGYLQRCTGALCGGRCCHRCRKGFSSPA